MTAADGVAVVAVLAVTAWACSGLADHGAGFWDLVAGGPRRGRHARSLIDTAITPVWEANHVWLVFLLVVCWTGFGTAFAAALSTLFIPFSLAAFGIVLRGANFALRKDAARAGRRHLTGWLFGVGSILTPFFLGAALGGIMSARVPVGNAAGDAVTSWWNPTSIAVGLLAVAVGAFLSAIYLVAVARRRAADLVPYFRRRALVAAATGLIVGVAALVALRADERQMFDRVVGRSWALIVVGVLALGVSFAFAARGLVRGLRLVTAVGVAALVWAWGVAQYPYLLPFGLTIDSGAGAAAAQRWLLVWSLVALLLVGPALVLLYALDQRGELGEEAPVTKSPPAAPPG